MLRFFGRGILGRRLLAEFVPDVERRLLREIGFGFGNVADVTGLGIMCRVGRVCLFELSGANAP